VFYVKATLSPGVTLITRVQNDNIYTRCPDCGKELQIDLNQLIHDDQIDLDESSINCPICFLKHFMKEVRK
jgi:hypothetical protein